MISGEERHEKLKEISSSIDDYFQQEFEKNHFPGLIYGLVADGHVVRTGSFGSTNVEQKYAPNTQSLFRIASMTKSFTAMAIVKLRDEGKLHLDDPVVQYVPEMKMTDFLTADAPTLTIRHLLIQHAGMPEDDPWADRQLALPDNDFLRLLNKGVSLSNPPGTVWEYTNLAYALLGRIITVVAQQPYQQYITKEILQPLGMHSTVWEYSEISLDRLVQGYRWENETYRKEELLHDGAFGAMGGLISCIDDFVKYMNYHMQAWPPRDEPDIGPIRRSSLREMHHPWNFIELKSYKHRTCSVTRAYAYGLIWSKDQDGVISINHTGGLPGFGSNWIIFPEHGLGLVSFANGTYANLGEINSTIMDQLMRQVELQPHPKPIPPILTQRKEELRKFILEQHWSSGSIDPSKIFPENFFLDQSLELRKAAFETALQPLGSIQHIGDLKPKNRLRARFEIKGEHGTIAVTFSLSPENPPLIQELKIN